MLQYISISPFEKVPLAEIFKNEIQQDVKELNSYSIENLIIKTQR